MNSTIQSTEAFSVTIIGGGAAGTLLAAWLLRRQIPHLEVNIVERRRESLGRGMAYKSSEGTWHLLNVPARGMSAFEDNPEHFFAWAKQQALTRHPLLRSSVEPLDFLPRAVYGEYLQSVLDEAAKIGARSEAHLNVIEGEAEDVLHDGKHIWTVLADGRRIPSHHCVLALGHLPSEYPLRKPLPAYQDERYIHHPWESERIANIPKTARVMIAGTGLTAFDLAISLRCHGHEGSIAMISRRGMVPAVHRFYNGNPPDMSKLLNLANVREILREIRKASSSYEWRAVIDGMRKITPQLWQKLPESERRRFMRHLRVFWETHRHRVAPEIHERIVAMLTSGNVRIHAARILGIEAKTEQLDVKIVTRSPDARVSTLGFEAIINCTGPRSDFTKFQHPLLINLLANSVLTHDALALGIKATPDGRLVSFHGEVQDWISTLGVPLKGILWETSAIPEIRRQAEALSGRLEAFAAGGEWKKPLFPEED